MNTRETERARLQSQAREHQAEAERLERAARNATDERTVAALNAQASDRRARAREAQARAKVL